MTILLATHQPCDFPTNWAGPELTPEGAPGGNSCQPSLESVQGHHLCLPWSYSQPGASHFGHNKEESGLRDVHFDQLIHTYLYGASVPGVQKWGLDTGDFFESLTPIHGVPWFFSSSKKIRRPSIPIDCISITPTAVRTHRNPRCPALGRKSFIHPGSGPQPLSSFFLVGHPKAAEDVTLYRGSATLY